MCPAPPLPSLPRSCSASAAKPGSTSAQPPATPASPSNSCRAVRFRPITRMSPVLWCRGYRSGMNSAPHAAAPRWIGRRVTEREKAAIFVPADTSPQEVRDCLHEELAQAMGPLNDLYQLPNSVFNDDNFNTVLTSFDMMMLRMHYAPELHSGMTQAEVAGRLPGMLVADQSRWRGCATGRPCRHTPRMDHRHGRRTWAAQFGPRTQGGSTAGVDHRHGAGLARRPHGFQPVRRLAVCILGSDPASSAARLYRGRAHLSQPARRDHSCSPCRYAACRSCPVAGQCRQMPSRCADRAIPGDARRRECRHAGQPC